GHARLRREDARQAGRARRGRVPGTERQDDEPLPLVDAHRAARRASDRRDRVLPRRLSLEGGSGPQDQARREAGLVDRRVRDRRRRPSAARAGRRLHVRAPGDSRAGRSLMTRSLWPREHGAYAQLGAPLATALARQVPTVPAALLAAAACCAFLANEPLLV